MIIRQLTQRQFERLNEFLRRSAHAEPLDASYTATMTVNGAEYALKIQPERYNRMAVLQALRVFREEDGPNFELITRGNLLSSLLELFIEQQAKPAV